MAKEKSTKTEHYTSKHHHDPLQFPDGFLWGAASSSYQVEGGNHNDWTLWEKGKGRVKDKSVCGEAARHYSLYEEDFKLAKKLNQNAHRLSLEWSRIESERGKWNMKEVEHYRAVLQSLRKNGIKTFVNLHHFTNPIWVGEQGAWARRKTVRDFCRYVEFVVDNFSDLIDFWLTVNEPLINVTLSYLIGNWPPGKKGPVNAFLAYKNLAAAHRKAYKIIHKKLDSAEKKPMVGFANNTASFYTYRKDKLLDFLFVKLSDLIGNDLFYILTGKKTHDFIGLNYYFHYRVKKPDFNALGRFVSAEKEGREASDIGWEINPQGIFDALLDVNKYNLPIYILENGVAASVDHTRQRFIISYLKEVFHAIKEGVPVKGYFYWSLTDGFEWENGYIPRYGLVDVDFKTFKRSVRPSGKLYAEICGNNAIIHEELYYLGHLTEYGERGEMMDGKYTK
jgi:beta-glucosidase